MAVTVTNSTISAYNTITTVTSNAATADTDALAEVFTITPTKAGNKLLLIIGGVGSAADGNISYSIAAGKLHASKAITGTVTKNTEKCLMIETAKILQDDGKILLTLTPIATDKLKTDLTAYVKFIEMY